ncbi:LytR/AlgR family response regulator transcription factor [Brevundimonas sp. NPDC092305]|uniref:LytR/AlgR family response regulator transcription factor n=1 Tax=Brevundimonas sp. NPDC092305 TaxID=3363957 RepID=UPI0037FB2F0E
MRALIVDDEPPARELLRSLLEASPGVEVVGAARSAEEADAAIAALQPDVVFLDIQMPGQSGVDLARSLEGAHPAAVVFVTAYDQYALEAFDVSAVDYLLKPIDPERLAVSLRRARRWTGRAGDGPRRSEDAASPAAGWTTGVWVQKRHGQVRLSVEDIDWIEAARDYVLLHTQRQSHMLRATMDTLQATLDPDVMMRISRSNFVNRRSIRSFHEHGKRNLVVVLEDGTGLRVGSTYHRQIWRRLVRDGSPGEGRARSDQG